MEPEACTVLKTRADREIIPPLTVRRLQCPVEIALQWEGSDIPVEPIHLQPADEMKMAIDFYERDFT